MFGYQEPQPFLQRTVPHNNQQKLKLGISSDDSELTQARLALCAGAKQVLANLLGLVGVSAPEAMDS
jgi:hypothetical protein